MIDFEIPAKIKQELMMVEMVANQVMRPQSRYLDEHEHERPTAFVNMMWPIIKDQNRRQVERWQQNGGAKEKTSGPSTAILRLIMLIEQLSWGDTGQYLCMPGVVWAARPWKPSAQRSKKSAS